MKTASVVWGFAEATLFFVVPDVLISQIMERLIVESLQVQEAERRGVTVDDETLTRAVSEFARENNMSIEQFAQRLAVAGFALFDQCNFQRVTHKYNPPSKKLVKN